MLSATLFSVILACIPFVIAQDHDPTSDTCRRFKHDLCRRLDLVYLRWIGLLRSVKLEQQQRCSSEQILILSVVRTLD